MANVLSFPVINALDLWKNYTEKRGLTLKGMCPPAQLLPREEAAKLIGKHLNGFMPVAAFVFPANGNPDCPHLNSKIIYAPTADIPRPTEALQKKKPKYLSQEGSPSYLYIPPCLTDWKNPDNKYDLHIVEGPLVAQKLAEEGIRAVGLNGIWNFRIKGKTSPTFPDLIELARCANVQSITILGDADVPDRPDLQAGVNTLALELVKLRPERIDTLYTCFPPAAADGTKLGPDDYLQQQGPDEFLRLLREQRRRWDDHPYLQVERRWIERVIYNEHSGKFFDCSIRKEVERDHINMNMAPGSRVLDIQSSRGKIIGYKSDQYLISPAARIAQGIRFQPDEPQEFFQGADGLRYINKSRPEDFPVPIKGDVSIFYEVLKNLCKDSPSAEQKIVTACAKHAQQPVFAPIKHAILLTGEQRAGKSTMAKCIGYALSKRFSSVRVNLTDKFNAHWRGFACREWAELDKHMDGEWLKDLITAPTYTVRDMRVSPYDENNYTLNIFTANGMESKLQEGDERFVVAGYARRDDQRLGLEFERWVDGPGPQNLRYHLLYEVDCSTYDTMGVWTELREAVINASKDYKQTVKDEIIFMIQNVPGLECLPNSTLEYLLESHKTNTISFIKANAQHFIKPLRESVKIDGQVVRFRAALNHDYWKTCDDRDKYVEQYNLAAKLLSGKKF